ncbi:MAG TPA: hypothetical protein PKC70_10945, partial [Cellvibrionaceae bacterium]|nr:hypothetical protein [Cellvibrionaceae bacterium]
TGQTPNLPVGADQRLFNSEDFVPERAFFAERLSRCEPRWQQKYIEAYANPVAAKLKLAHVG